MKLPSVIIADPFGAAYVLFSQHVENAVPALVSRGFQAEVFKLPPRKITKTYFSKYIPEISKQDSQAMYEALETKGYLTSSNEGVYLSADPRSNPDVLATIILSNRKLEDELVEELNVLWGRHELSSEECDIWLQKMKDRL